ncbi:MAG: glutamine synthetase family protein [Candidatus Diapherotrites archaeon]
MKKHPGKPSSTNTIAQFLGIEPSNFTVEALARFAMENSIEILNFNYVAADGRLKTLSFAIRNEEHLKELLEFGERVDGSSLFPYIDTGNSDLYVVPRLKTAFLNPFSEIPAINILCSYFDRKGKELEIAPEFVVKKAHNVFKQKTGLELRALGELEYYVVFPKPELELFPGKSQKHYHESPPFSKFHFLNEQILETLKNMGIKAKYGHAEVGNIELNGKRLEQFEIELDLEPIEDMADNIVLAKWVMRNTALLHGVEITFAPKLSVGHAGSGMHIHIAAFQNEKNVFLDKNQELSETAKRIIGGLIELAPSLTAFGNTVPVSYLRLVPHQEAPTNVCWGDSNRSVLIRVPLGWRNIENLSAIANNQKKKTKIQPKTRQTVELRSPDGSANAHLLLAGIAVAARHGLENKECLEIAKRTYVGVNIFKEEHKKIQESLEQLPSSCFESAEKLREQSKFYFENNVFCERILEGIQAQLKSYNDKDLNKDLKLDKERAEEYIKGFLHCG